MSKDFAEVKYDFYRDSEALADSVLWTLGRFEHDYPPYGLVSLGKAATDFAATDRPWIKLEKAMTDTMHRAYDQTVPPIAECPYHEVVTEKLIPRKLQPIDHNVSGLDAFREASAVGGILAPATVVNLLRRIPAMKQVHGATSDVASLARASSGLLAEPLAHPQQHAKAFVFTLTGEARGAGFTYDRDKFFPVDLIEKYTKLVLLGSGLERIDWALPTEDFTLRSPITVVSRVTGSERNDNPNDVTYPIGTRLGDIKVDEPTIGCPGKRVAYALWRKGAAVATAEALWDRA